MKTGYKNIYEVLKLNRWVTISVSVTALLATAFSGVMVFSIYNRAVNSAFVVSHNGQVIPLQLVERKENLQVEALAHLELFHRLFYGLDASNYEKNLQRALWLGDASVDQVYLQKKADGVYNRLLQYGLVQKVLSVDTQLHLEQEPYAFVTKLVFEINRGSVVDRYQLTTKGSLLSVDRQFPNNTHGLLITDFFEKELKKVTP